MAVYCIALQVFPETPTIAIQAHCLQTTSVWLRLANINGHIIGQKITYTAYFDFHSKIFPETLHLLMYQHSRKYLFFYSMNFLLHSTTSTVYALFTISNIFCHQSVVTGTQSVQQRISRLYLGFDLRDFPETPPPPVTTPALPTKGLNLSSANNKEHIMLGKYLCFIF